MGSSPVVYALTIACSASLTVMPSTESGSICGSDRVPSSRTETGKPSEGAWPVVSTTLTGGTTSASPRTPST